MMNLGHVYDVLADARNQLARAHRLDVSPDGVMEVEQRIAAVQQAPLDLSAEGIVDDLEHHVHGLSMTLDLREAQ